MSAPPYMKLYIADYHVETTDLDVVGHGAYLLLLMAMWRAGGKLPRDEGKLRRLAKCTAEQWADVSADVLAHFKVSGGSITHTRVKKEIAKYDAVVKGSREGGEATQSKRRSKNNGQSASVPSNNSEGSGNQPEPELIEAIASLSGQAPVTKAKSAKRKPETPIPDSFPDAEALDDARSKAAEAGAEVHVRVEGERFRNHALQVDRRCRDWRAAWRNWIVGTIEKAPKRSVVLPLLAAAAQRSPDDLWRDRVRKFKTGSGYWDDIEWGPRPGREGCKAPAAIIEEFSTPARASA